MTKKILLIVGILAIVGVVAFLILSSKPASETGEGSGFSIRQFLPFGKGSEPAAVPSNTSNNGTEEPSQNVGAGQPISRLRKISSEPVAGAVIFNVGTTSVVRFVEKGTGNVYEARSDSNYIQRLTNTTLPKILRVFWLPNGNSFLAQTLIPETEIIETSLVKLGKNQATTSAESLTPFGTVISKLPSNIREIAVKPDGAKIFYYTVSGSSEWFVSNPDGTASVLVNTSPLSEWLPKWQSGNTVIMQTKSTGGSISYSYSFDTSSKAMKKFGVGAFGLSLNPNPDGSVSLISSGGSNPSLFTAETKSAVPQKITAIATLADKCAWAKTKAPTVYCAVPEQLPAGNYPDVWYQGLASTEDFLVKLDLSNDISYKIAELSDLSKEAIDVSDINISPSGDYLVFRNKKDGFLWLLKIEED